MAADLERESGHSNRSRAAMMASSSGTIAIRALAIVFAICGTISGCAATVAPRDVTAADPCDLPMYDHIVVVMEENHGLQEITGSPDAEFINRVGREGVRFSAMFGEEHPSMNNYFWLFSGSNKGGNIWDAVPRKLLRHSNLGAQLILHGWSFTGFAETLPDNRAGFGWEERKSSEGFKLDGSEAPCKQPPNSGCVYAGKHVPWRSFQPPQAANSPLSPELACPRLENARRPNPNSFGWSQPFHRFPPQGHFDDLPTVALVIPNMRHDMHDQPSADDDKANLPACVRRDLSGNHAKIANADCWLRVNLGDYYEWAKTHNSLLIITFDEDANEEKGGIQAGPTNPGDHNPIRRNLIPTVIGGDHLVPGGFTESKPVTHVNLLRTIEAIYGLPKSGTQPWFATHAGIDDEFVGGIFRRASR